MKRIASFLLAFALLLETAAYSYADGTAVSEEIQSDCCIVLSDTTTGQVLFSQHPNEVTAAGTSVKLMTVLLAAEAVESGTLGLEQELTASSTANKSGGATIWLMQGEKMTVEDLLKAVIIGNANDASIVLAEKLGSTEERFVKLMNSRASELNMIRTSYTDCCGLDNGSTTTAYDLSLLLNELSKHEFLTPYFTTWRTFIRGELTELVNANILVKDYKGICGFKAGNAGDMFYCAAAAKRDEQTYTAVVMGSTDKDYAFTRAKKLMSWAFSDFERVMPEIDERYTLPVDVSNGVKENIETELAGVLPVTIYKGDSKKVFTEIARKESVAAPVCKGDYLGTLTVYYNGKVIYEARLTAAENVDKMTLGYALCRLLEYAFET